jgi:hypothetical protein
MLYIAQSCLLLIGVIVLHYNISTIVLNLSQIIRCFDFSRYIVFPIYLDIVYIYMHSKYNVSRKAKTSYNL